MNIKRISSIFLLSLMLLSNTACITFIELDSKRVESTISYEHVIDEVRIQRWRIDVSHFMATFV